MKAAKLFFLILTITIFATACKKSNTSPANIPANLIGRWNIQYTVFSYNYVAGGYFADTLKSTNTYPNYQLNQDGTFSELDGDNALIQTGNFSASEQGNTFQLNLTYNGGNSKICNGFFTTANSFTLSFTNPLPGNPTVFSITTTQSTVKAQ